MTLKASSQLTTITLIHSLLQYETKDARERESYSLARADNVRISSHRIHIGAANRLVQSFSFSDHCSLNLDLT